MLPTQTQGLPIADILACPTHLILDSALTTPFLIWSTPYTQSEDDMRIALEA